MSKQIEGEEPGVEGDKLGKRHGDSTDAGKGRKMGQDVPDEVRRKAGYPDAEGK